MHKIYSFLIISLFIFSTACHDSKKTDHDVQNLIESESTAIDSISLKIRETPTNDALFATRAELYFKENKIEEAINDYQIAHRLDTTNINYYIKLADYQLILGLSGKVKDVLDKANKNYPDNLDIILRLARLHLYVQQYKESAKFVEQAMKIDPQFAESYFLKALISKELGDTIRAVDNFLIATQKEPDYYEAFIMLAMLGAEKNDDIAIDYYNNAIDIQPKSFEAHYNLAMYYQQRNMLEEAFEAYDNILNNVDSLASIVYFNKGYIRLVLEQKYEEAIPHFEKAVEIDPSYFEAYHNLGICHEQLGKNDLAREFYEKVLTLQPNYQLSILALNRLDEQINNN